jgi:hypothetical protein
MYASDGLWILEKEWELCKGGGTCCARAKERWFFFFIDLTNFLCIIGPIRD